MAKAHTAFSVVVDTKGAGRIVGVFDDAERVERIAAIDPNYFRVVRMTLNEINPVAVEWLPDPAQRKRLQHA